MNLEYVRAVFPNGDLYHMTVSEGTTITLEEDIIFVESNGETTAITLSAIPMVTYKELTT